MQTPNNNFVKSISSADIGRTTIPISHKHSITMSAGLLTPFLAKEVLPGETVNIDTSALCRMMTPIHPVMDSAFIDIFYFYCPNRLVWDHWVNFMGAPGEDPYIEDVQYSVPFLINPDPSLPQNSIVPHSVADYMGEPIYSMIPDTSALRYRAFGRIWNEWFRDQNLQNAIDVPTDDADRELCVFNNLNTRDIDGILKPAGRWQDEHEDIIAGLLTVVRPDDGVESNEYITTTARGGALPPVNKFHDYFTSALLQPQRGDPVAIPISGFAPVYSTALSTGNRSTSAVRLIDHNGDTLDGNVVSDGTLSVDRYVSAPSGETVFLDGLIADLGASKDFSDAQMYATINDLRYAFATQKLLENDARFGGRYVEQLKAHFGVTAPSGLLQRTEYLFGKRQRIGMQQVLQTSATNDISPQGNTAAYSLTATTGNTFTKSFVEHGWLIGVCCVRNINTYQQGQVKSALRRNRYQFFFPEMANISEQPILNRELYIPSIINGGDVDLDATFGFQEAWAEYRFMPNRISGSLSSNYARSLDVWHYGDFYVQSPYLSDSWIRSDRANIDRTLAVSSQVEDQFICDFQLFGNDVVPMPLYSIPGMQSHL